ncbi:hypothetical protein [Leucobacter sp. 1207-22]|uniref:hypothetical protein n=1 Tax=Leucobacter sp. 1207-22 TaxID=2604456 RepID=UPI00406307BF
MLYVRGPERSARQKHAIVWSRVAWFVLLTVKGKNVNTGEEFDVLMDNHNRITWNRKDKQMALEDLKELVR